MSEIYPETTKIQQQLKESGIEISLEALQNIVMTKFDESTDCPDCLQLIGGICFSCLMKAVQVRDAPSAEELHKALEDPEA